MFQKESKRRRERNTSEKRNCPQGKVVKGKRKPRQQEQEGRRTENNLSHSKLSAWFVEFYVSDKILREANKKLATSSQASFPRSAKKDPNLDRNSILFLGFLLSPQKDDRKRSLKIENFDINATPRKTI